MCWSERLFRRVVFGGGRSACGPLPSPLWAVSVPLSATRWPANLLPDSGSPYLKLWNNGYFFYITWCIAQPNQDDWFKKKNKKKTLQCYFTNSRGRYTAAHTGHDKSDRITLNESKFCKISFTQTDICNVFSKAMEKYWNVIMLMLPSNSSSAGSKIFST